MVGTFIGMREESGGTELTFINQHVFSINQRGEKEKPAQNARLSEDREAWRVCFLLGTVLGLSRFDQLRPRHPITGNHEAKGNHEN